MATQKHPHSKPQSLTQTHSRLSHVSPQSLAAQIQSHINPQSLLRLPRVLAIYPVGKSTWWKGIAEGRYPRPIKLGPRAVAWRARDVLALVEGGSTDE